MKKNYFMLLLAATFTFAATAQDVLLWGGKDTKEGSFDGGLNGWTTYGVADTSANPKPNTNALWNWTSTSNGTPSAFSNNIAINSATKANGAAIFNSDFLDSGGDQNGLGTGAAPAPHIGALVSPTIDLSAEKNGVAVVFSQSFGNYQSKTFLQYSNDDGVSWSTTFPILNNDVLKQGTLLPAANMVTKVQMPGAGGTSKFKVRFVFSGDFYVWIVDDVSIIRIEDYNLRVNKNFYATAENYSTPLAQIRPMPFLNDIQNVGGKAQNATHTLTIKQGASVVYVDSLNYNPFAKSDSAIENKLFKTTYLPKVKGAHTGTYSIQGTQKDFDLTDNNVSFNFVVSDSTFAKERLRSGGSGEVTPSLSVSGTDKSWQYGNIFHVNKGKGFKSGTMEIGLTNAAAVKDQTLYLAIKEWEDANNNGTFFDDDDLGELKIVGFLEYTITGKEVAPVLGNAASKLTKVKIPNFDDDSKPIQLKDDTYYVAMIEYDGTKNLPTTPTPKLATSNEPDYVAAQLAHDALNGAASFTSVLKLNDNVFSGFRGIVPMIRWNVVPNTVGADDIKLAETSVKVGPNPTAEYVNINFNFEKNMENIDVRIIDMAGKSVMNATYDNIQTDVKTLNVNNLANGTYQMVISTNDGAITKSFVVQR